MPKPFSIASAVPAIEWRQTALGDLLAIIDYIADDNPDAAQQLKDDIEAKVLTLAHHPKLYRAGRVGGTSGDGGPLELRVGVQRKRHHGIHPAHPARGPTVATPVVARGLPLREGFQPRCSTGPGRRG